MFRKTDAELRKEADQLIDTNMGIGSIPQLKRAIKLRRQLQHITPDDKRAIATCYSYIAAHISCDHDESAQDEFESRTRHPEFFWHLKMAIYAINDIPFKEQTLKDIDNVDCWYSDIMTNYYYFRMPDEAVMDDHFLRVTSKYLARKTALDVQEKLEQFVASQSYQRRM